MSTIGIVELVEFVQSPGPLKVDRDKGVIHGVKVLGWKSANGRRYLPEGVDERMYANRPVYVDHPEPGRKTPRASRDKFGRIVNPTKRDDGIYGDLQFLTSHEMAPRVCEAAERMPDVFGLSHNARGREKRQGGEAIIEAVESVTSVDLVSEAATVSGLFEAKGPAMATSTVKAILEGFAAKRPAYVKRLREMADAGVVAPETAMPEPAGVAGAGDADSALKDGFRAAIMAAIDDDSLDMAGKLAKVKEIMKAQEKLMAPKEEPKPDGGGTDGGSGGESGTSEGKKPDEAAALREQVERLRLQVQIKDEVAAAGVRPSKVLAKALDACTTLQEAKDLIADAKQSSGGPRSAAAAPPPAGDKPLPKSPKELREQYAR